MLREALMRDGSRPDEISLIPYLTLEEGRQFFAMISGRLIMLGHVKAAHFIEQLHGTFLKVPGWENSMDVDVEQLMLTL